jgi:hypothetical protein
LGNRRSRDGASLLNNPDVDLRDDSVSSRNTFSARDFDAVFVTLYLFCGESTLERVAFCVFVVCSDVVDTFEVGASLPIVTVGILLIVRVEDVLCAYKSISHFMDGRV